MPNATGTHAHLTRSAPSGITHVITDGAAIIAACEPQSPVATTRWPTNRSVTPSPTSMIVPADW